MVWRARFGFCCCELRIDEASLQVLGQRMERRLWETTGWGGISAAHNRLIRFVE